MKKFITIIFMFTLFIGSSYAQIGIGTITPDASAVLEVSATNKGFLPPRVANVSAIAAPVAGLLVYDISEQCIKYYNGTVWSGCLSDGSGTPTAVAGTVDCGSLAVNGTYELGTAITASETVTLNVNFTVAGAWSASTGTINGYSFVGSGTVAAIGVQPITLTATGTPTAAQTDAFTLTFNNPTQTCSFSVTVSAAASFGPCGAYVAAGVYKEFMCHNLGANTTLDPTVPVQGIYGNYYQWGSSTVVADASTPSGVIAGWNITNAPNGSWSDASKTANDPCPAGFRVPTNAQWAGVIANNTVSRTGSWANDGNFATAIHWGPDVSTKTLTLPAAGARSGTDGSLAERGSSGYYWSSGELGSGLGARLGFTSTTADPGYAARVAGLSVRCVSE